MISYAQNFEDVMLARALSSVGRGFYIDIGAWHPDRHSVTRHFYEAGWRGVNVEPGKTYFDLLRRRRRRDTNLNVVISDRPGQLVFHEAPHSGLSGTDPAVLATAGRLGIQTQSFTVQAITLAELCERHVPPGGDIHFLKIDVEGHEAAVIRSGDWERFRPWIVVLEAITPAGEPAWEAFEADLQSKDYAFAWFDGLNRFYVRRESEALLGRFNSPPNVFDGVVHFPDDRIGRAMEWCYGLLRRLHHRFKR